MESNPYASPAADLYGPSTLGSDDAVAASTISHLQRTKPWVRFISVLFGIGAALMLVGAVGMLVTVFVVGQGRSMPGSGIPMLIPCVMYFLLGLLYFYPARRLGYYSRNIRKLMDSHAYSDLEAALREQRRFWKFQGILTIVMISIWVLAILAALASAASGFGR